MNEMKVFDNDEFGTVRGIEIDGEAWLVGKDVAGVLGYANPNEAISDHVDEEDKLNSKTLPSFDIDIGQRGGWFINESGFYSLVMSSKLPTAKKFKRWVTSEVLPTIRKHGVYLTKENLKAVMNDPAFLIGILQGLQEEQNKVKTLQEVNAIQAQQIAEYEPKATYCQQVLECRDAVTITVIAKDYGWTARQMNEYLHDKGVQFKYSGHTWLLYKKYADKGYTKTKTYKYTDGFGAEHTDVQTRWTQAGRFFIYELLKEDGVLPLIEMETTVDDESKEAV